MGEGSVSEMRYGYDRGYAAGRGEKSKELLAETFPNSQFLWVSTPSTSLGPDRWIQCEGYGGPNMGEKSFQLFFIFIV